MHFRLENLCQSLNFSDRWLLCCIHWVLLLTWWKNAALSLIHINGQVTEAELYWEWGPRLLHVNIVSWLGRVEKWLSHLWQDVLTLLLVQIILVIARSGLTDARQRLLRLLLASHLIQAFSIFCTKIGLVTTCSEEKVAIYAAVTIELRWVALLRHLILGHSCRCIKFQVIAIDLLDDRGATELMKVIISTVKVILLLTLTFINLAHMCASVQLIHIRERRYRSFTDLFREFSL